MALPCVAVAFVLVNVVQVGTMNWMKLELQKLTVITQMHVFSYITLPSLGDHISKKSIEVYWLRLILCGADDEDVSFLLDMRRDSFIRTLCKVLPMFTTREMKIMFTGLVSKASAETMCELMFAVLDALLLLEAAVVPSINQETDCPIVEPEISSAASTCLQFCIKNAVQIIQDVVLVRAEEISSELLIELLIKMCYILRNFPLATKNYSSWILLKVLQDFVNICVQKQVNASSDFNKLEVNRLCAAISLIPSAEIRQNLTKSLFSYAKIKFSSTVLHK